MWEFLIILASVLYWGSPVGISSILGHCGTVLISISRLKTVSKNLTFWFLIFVAIFFSSESRLSLEYTLYAAGFFYFGIHKNQLASQNIEARRTILFLIFLLIIILDRFNLCLSEKGSLVLWIPIYLSLYFNRLNKKNWTAYLLFGVFIFSLNKLSALIAFVTVLRSKVFYFLSILILPIYFYFKQNIFDFLLKSLNPRVYIFISAMKGFLDKPILGHGFGTFSLDFPPYRIHGQVLGGRTSEYIIHGHNLFSHYSFELGIIGVSFIFLFFYLVYINKPNALIPLTITSLFDSPLVNFNQYLLAGLLFIPFIKHHGFLSKIKLTFTNRLINNSLFASAIIISIFSFVPSLVGHYFYSCENLDNAIKWDKNNPLYYFTRGAKILNKNTIQSEIDLKIATELAPSIPYFYGFLGAAQLSNNKIKEAKISLEKAMKLDGKDGYWCLLYAYTNYNNKNIFQEYMNKALKKDPEIKTLLNEPIKTSSRYIGYSKDGDIRLAGFYRTGERIYFPLPVIEKPVDLH